MMLKTLVLLSALFAAEIALGAATSIKDNSASNFAVVHPDGTFDVNIMSGGMTCNPGTYSVVSPLAINGSNQIYAPNMQGDAGAGGAAGWCPAPAAGDSAAGKFLKADGTYAVPGGGVTSVTGTAPVVSSGGNTPAISMAAATDSINGYLTAVDHAAFNAKQAAITTLGVGQGGTGTSTAFTVGSVIFAKTSGVYGQDNAHIFWDDTNFRLGVNTASPTNGAIDARPSADATGGSIALTSFSGSNSVSMGVSNAGTFRLVNQMSGSHTIMAVTGSQDAFTWGGGSKSAFFSLKGAGATPNSFVTLTIEALSTQTADNVQVFGTDAVQRFSVDKLGFPYLAAQGSGTTPATTVTGAFAVTNGGILCRYNGTAWKQTSDGSTTCTF